MNETKSLRASPYEARHILVTGANGYVGSMVVASLLRDTAARITCLVRAGREGSTALKPIIEEWQQQARARWSRAIEQRMTIRSLPTDLADLPAMTADLAFVDEIVHCAGCLDYNHSARLREANIAYTAHLMVLARRLRVSRVVFISTAFSAGYASGVIKEGRPPEPPGDPTAYTRSKREAERIVAASGLPYLVLRPAILIGSSVDGRYSGKRYGLVQQWTSLEELVCERHHSEVHVVANEAPVNVVHQDAFCAAFKAAHRWLPDGSTMNLVSNAATVPTLRELWELWFEITRPTYAHAYERVADVALRQIPSRQRAYLSFAKVNLEIAAHHWRFETGWMELLRDRGLRFADADLDSVRTCQDRHVSASARIASYRAEHATLLAEQWSASWVRPADRAKRAA